MTDDQNTKPATENEKPEEKTREFHDEPPVQTRHEIRVGRKNLSYYASAGMMPMKDDKGEIEAQMFFVAYTLDDPKGNPKRPLTFAFNGGPGSASIWLHMGTLGPKRVRLNDDGSMPPPPFVIEDSTETWLTETDLVFIDPIGTGFSRAKTPEIAEKYWGYTKDIESVGEFIRLYLTRNGRWSSPLFLAGESYGTIRASGLAGHLIDRGIAFNGVILVSALLQYMTLRMDDKRGNDVPYPLFLPTYAATAWFHGKLPDDLQKRRLPELLREVEEWAMRDYLLALTRGDALPDAERRQVLSTLARYTGLSERFIDNSELRVNIMRFCKELLRDEKKTVGRIDSRFTGRDSLAVKDTPDFDPSISGLTPPFTAAINDYLRNQLGFEIDDEYETLSYKVNQKWKFDAERSGYLETLAAFRNAFAKNPYMKVMVPYGYYDLATPYYAIMHSFNHFGLGKAVRENVTWAGYESGHMMYIDSKERVRLKDDVARFMREAMPSS